MNCFVRASDSFADNLGWVCGCRDAACHVDTGRKKEIAVLISLGVSKGSIFLQMLLEELGVPIMVTGEVILLSVCSVPGIIVWLLSFFHACLWQ